MKFLLLFIATSLVACYGKEPTVTGLEGKSIPSFKLLLSDNKTWFNSNQITLGKPTAFFLFSPNCPYCRAQMQEIVEDMDKLKDIQFYLVTSSPIKEIKDFYKQYHLERYPNIITGIDSTSFLADYFEIVGVPFIAVYGNDKRLKQAFVGKTYSSQIKRATLK